MIRVPFLTLLWREKALIAGDAVVCREAGCRVRLKRARPWWGNLGE